MNCNSLVNYQHDTDGTERDGMSEMKVTTKQMRMVYDDHEAYRRLSYTVSGR